MKYKYFLIAWAIMGYMNIQAQESVSISLFDCFQKARNYHPYASDRQRMEETRALKERNISTSWYPQLNLNGQATYQSDATQVEVSIPGVNIKGSPLDQYKVNLDINQVLYDGGIAKAQKNITNTSVDIDLQQNETEIYKVNDQVSLVYFNLLLLQKNGEIYKATLDDLKSKESKVESSVKNGVLVQSDLDNLKVEIIRTNQMLDDVAYAMKNSYNIMQELTGDSLIWSYKLIVPNVATISNDTIYRPELKVFELQKSSLEESKYLSGTQKKPRLYAFSQLGYGRPGLNMLKDSFQPYYIVGVKLQWNFLDWNKSQREKGIYSIQQDMINSKKESYIRNINISSKNELTKIQQLENSLKTDEEILTLRKEIVFQSEKKLDQGVITMSDYLTEYNAEVRAGLQFETHKIQLLQSKINYMIIKGLL